MFSTQFVQLGLVELALVPQFVNSLLRQFSKKERQSQFQCVQIFLCSDIGSRVHQFQLCPIVQFPNNS